MLLTIFTPGHVAAAADSAAAFSSSEGAVPLNVKVSPTRFKPKPGMPMAALNTPPSPAMSGTVTPGVMVSSSMIFAPGIVVTSVSTNDVFVASSGTSPATVKPMAPAGSPTLPLRTIENGAYPPAGMPARRLGGAGLAVVEGVGDGFGHGARNTRVLVGRALPVPT